MYDDDDEGGGEWVELHGYNKQDHQTLLFHMSVVKQKIIEKKNQFQSHTHIQLIS